jgi:hypothetical protein
MAFLKPTLVALPLLTAMSFGALAHDTAPIDRAQAWQMQQIQEGRRNGSLTRREYEALMAEQARIADMERRAQVGGVTGREYRELRQAQKEAAANIAAEATDRQVNIWRRWRSQRGH